MFRGRDGCHTGFAILGLPSLVGRSCTDAARRAESRARRFRERWDDACALLCPLVSFEFVSSDVCAVEDAVPRSEDADCDASVTDPTASDAKDAAVSCGAADDDASLTCHEECVDTDALLLLPPCVVQQGKRLSDPLEYSPWRNDDDDGTLLSALAAQLAAVVAARKRVMRARWSIAKEISRRQLRIVHDAVAVVGCQGNGS